MRPYVDLDRRLHTVGGGGRTRPRHVARVGLISVHTSPLSQPGAGDGGGLNVYVREVARRLARAGVEVDIFTRRTDPAQPSTQLLDTNVAVHHITAGPVGPVSKDQVANHLCAFVLALQRHATAGAHDVLHAHYWLSGWVARRLARRWDVPFVQTFHTLGVLKNATLAPGDTPEPPLRLMAEQRVARDADGILALTNGEAHLLHRTYGLSRTKLSVVPAGVDLDLFRPEAAPVATVTPPTDRAGADRWYASGGARLLFVARLQPLKGPDVAVRTLAEVRRVLPDAQLRVVGEPSGSGSGMTSPQQLRALALSLGVNDALSFEPALRQQDLADRYREADVVLVPSRSETFGLVALEAQACGTPVVAADVPGLDSVVGDGGTLVAGHDPGDHAAAVVDYLTDRARTEAASRAGVAAARRASWDRTVDGLRDAYAQAVDRHLAQDLEPAPATAKLAG